MTGIFERTALKAGLLCAVFCGAACAGAETYVGAGIQSADSAAWFDAYDALVFKPGAFTYTGGDAAFAGTVTLDASGASHKVVTFDIADSNATVTLSGKVSGFGAGAFKTGPGTIRHVYPGPDKMTVADSNSGVVNNWQSFPAWDDSGVLTQATCAAYTVLDGKSVFDGGANQNLSFGGVYVGALGSAHDSTLEINGGCAALGSTAWARGSGTTTNRLKSTIAVRDAVVTFGSMMFTYSNGGQKYLADALLYADNSVLTNTGSIYFGESDSFNHFVLTNGSRFVHTHNQDLRKWIGGQSGGFEIPRGVGAQKGATITGVVDVVDNSTLAAIGLSVFPYGWLNVTGGSTLQFDRSVYYSTIGSTPTARGGSVYMDDATLEPMRPSMMSDWFIGLGDSTFRVGAKGLTVRTPLNSWLDPLPVAAAEGASLRKTGAGTFGVSRVRLPIAVEEGALRLGAHVSTDSNRVDGAVSLAEGATLSIGPARALDGVSVTAAGGNTVRFRPQAAGDFTDWTLHNEAKVRPDGILQLTDWVSANANFVTGAGKGFAFATNASGAAWSPRALDVTKSFKVSFNYFAPNLNWPMAYALAFAVHNAPEGRDASGGSSTAAGYAAANHLVGVRNSVGVYFGVHEPKTMFGRDAVWDETTAKSFERTDVVAGGARGETNVSFERPAWCEVSYDAAAHMMSVRYRSDPDDPRQFDTENSYAVDLREAVGADTAIFGFTASTDSGNPCQHSIMNVRVSYGDDAVVPKTLASGGALVAGGPFAKAEVYASPTRPGFAMDSLSFASGATLAVNAKGPTPRTANRPAYLSFDRYDGAGTLVKEGSGALGLVSTNAANVDLVLAAGGLTLRKEALESVTGGTRGDWHFSTDMNGYSALGDGIKIGTLTGNNKETAFLTRRIRATGKWRLSFRIVMPNDYVTADGWGFAFHNDPRGMNAIGNCFGDSGLMGIKNLFAVLNYNYCHNKSYTNRVQWCGTGYASSYGDADRSFGPEPITFYMGTDTRVAATYDSAAQTLALEFVQGENTVSHTFTGVDVRKMVGGDEAWFGFGTGGGGSHCRPDILDIRIDRLDGYADEWNDARYLKSLSVTAGEAPVYLTAETDTVFKLADAVALNGADLRVVATDAPATLAAGAWTGMDGVVTVDGAVLDLATVKPGPEAELRILNGGRVKANATTSTRFREVYVDGVALTGGFYTAATADWVASGRVSTRHGQGTVLTFR